MGEDFDKRNRFQEAFQRGQEGRVSNYEAWLQDQGITPHKARSEYLTQYFQENAESAVNHESQLEEVAEHIGFFSRRSDVFHLPVIGVSGIGKTQFLYTVSKLLGEMNAALGQEMVAATSFSELGEEESQIFELRDELRDQDKVVLLVDDCQWERVESLVKSFEVIDSVVDDALLLTAWTPEYWKHHREEVEQVLPVSKEVHLSQFSEPDTVSALEQVFGEVSDDGLNLPEALFQEIHEFSSGVPGVFVRLALETLKESFLKELELGDVEAVEAAAEKLNLAGLEERVYDLSDTKVTILTHMLLWVNKDGIRPGQLVDLLDRDKSTVSYHLKDLTSKGLVESEKRGREAYYRVKDPVKPMIQTRVYQDGEIHGEL